MTKFFVQKLKCIKLKPTYLAETLLLSSLRFTDAEDNQLTVYGPDYYKLKDYARKHFEKEPDKLTNDEKAQVISYAGIRLVRLFSPENIKKHEIDLATSSFTTDGDVLNMNGVPLEKGDRQNCIVMIDGHIYIHPKVRSTPLSDDSEDLGIIGINHSSFSQGRAVEFAGSLSFTPEHGWVIENTTGHYGTRAYQLNHFIKTLATKGVDISLLAVRLHIPKSHTGDKRGYDIYQENAVEFLSRIERSKENLDRSIAKTPKIMPN